VRDKYSFIKEKKMTNEVFLEKENEQFIHTIFNDNITYQTRIRQFIYI
jgi:hypothetical protein